VIVERHGELGQVGSGQRESSLAHPSIVAQPAGEPHEAIIRTSN
jgi:hypothetical protein